MTSLIILRVEELFIIGQHGGKIMKLGIKEGKIWDVCSDLRYKKDDSIPDKDYLDLLMGDWKIGDTWDFKTNESLKDSLQRFEEKPKTVLELKIEELEARILELESKSI